MSTLKVVSYGFWGACIFIAALISIDFMGLARHVAYDSDGPGTLWVLVMVLTALFSGFFFLMDDMVEGDFDN